MTTQYEIHPLADLLPRLGGAEYDALRDDIAEHGLQQPIVLFDGKILDGRHRYEACCELGVDVETIDYAGSNPVAYVLSANIHRRHLTPGQQSSVIALAMKYQAAMPEVSGKLAAQNERYAEKPPAKPEPTLQQIAKAAGVGERTLRHAKKVADADEELSKDVAAGKVSLPAAVEQITGKRPGKDDGKLAARVAELEAQVQQLSEDNRELIAENEAMGKIIDADDKLKAANAEIKALRSTIAKLEQRITGLQNEKNAAVRAAKSAQKKAAK